MTGVALQSMLNKDNHKEFHQLKDIDNISFDQQLKEKTKGNLTPAEENILQNVLFELRMAFLEITNAITRAPAPGSNKPAAK